MSQMCSWLHSAKQNTPTETMQRRSDTKQYVSTNRADVSMEKFS